MLEKISTLKKCQDKDGKVKIRLNNKIRNTEQRMRGVTVNLQEGTPP